MRTSVLIPFLLAATLALAQQPIAKQLNLSEMTELAGTIVRGKVLDVRTEPHPDYPIVSTLKVTLQVLEGVTATSDSRVSFRMYVGGGRFGRQTAKPSAATSFRVGDEVVLFMHAESRLGFSSPVGGEQGKFLVTRQAGKAAVVNGVGNRGLFNGIADAARSKGVALSAAQVQMAHNAAGAVDVDAFMQLVRQLAAKKVAR